MMIFVNDRSSSSKRKKSQNKKKSVVVYAKYTPPAFKTLKTPAVQPARRDDHRDIPSVSFTNLSVSTSKYEHLKYSGDRLVGISIVHKSCLQPVFSQQEATDVARMRR